MITTEQLYAQTRQGLDIILHYYPQASRCVDNPKEKFAARDERTASATLLPPNSHRNNSNYWKVCDFGDEGHSISPIDVALKIDGGRFAERVLSLASIFNVRDELNRSVNRPEFKERAATAEEQEGTKVFSLKKAIPAEHLVILAPQLKQEQAEALGWYEAEWVGYVKDRKVKEKHSTDNYPIFIRECRVPATEIEPSRSFFKIYEPLNPDKGFRFSYTPEGGKPRSYINGLEELKEQYRKFNEAEEHKFNTTNIDEEKSYKEQKLDEAIICSGERDALCARSLGYFPLWFNSESYRLSDEEYREICKYVKVVYNIPDLDATGRKKGTELALRFIDIHTVWLPDWLSTYRDHRGKPRKDLRDWMELRGSVKDFRDLLTLACPAKFWTEDFSKKKRVYEIDSVALIHFLQLNGFYRLKDDNSDSIKFIRITGNVVKEVRARDLRAFLNDYAEAQSLPRELRNLFITSPRVSTPFVMEALREVDLNFVNYTPTTQIFHLDGCAVEVSAEGIQQHKDASSLPHYVWYENVIPHRYNQLPPMFTIEQKGEGWDIAIHDTSSPFFGYCINSSRLHWRKEMEERFDDHEAREDYAKENHFRIDGDGLSDVEIAEQKLSLVNKIFTIGYMLHRYKAPSRAWAPQALDNKIGENGECNGRSGKSFLFRALAQLITCVKLSGRNPKLMDNPHVFDQVGLDTDFILVDDCAPTLSMGIFYDIITSDLTVNPKNNRSYTLPFDTAPKLAFTTNYVPSDFSPSTYARMIYMVYSDYYHERTEDNDYLQSRSIRDDFGRDLHGPTYPEQDWNRDINFALQCVRFYLSLCPTNTKIQAPLGNIQKRRFKVQMGNVFEDWAATYFCEDGDNLDRQLCRREVMANFLSEAGQLRRDYTTQTFTRQLKAFCNIAPHIAELNPAALLNSSQRMLKRIDGKLEEMIYLRSTRAEQLGEELNNTTQPMTLIPDAPKQEEAPF